LPGHTPSIGTDLTTGWENYVAVVSFACAYSDLDIVGTAVEALRFSPRIGFTHDLGRWGAAAIYTGADYLSADVELTGRVTIPLPPFLWLSVGRELVVDYAIDERNRDFWNALMGGNWDISKSFSLQGEIGLGGSRDEIIPSVTYRF
jgi:hypothetical protein